ncbi:MAG: CsbD family protein [Blastocatellia bacterium]
MAIPKIQPDNTLGEEASAFGERAKGAVKEAAGAVTGNDRLKNEGKRENAEGNARQEANDVFGETGKARSDTKWQNSWIGGSFSDRETAERAYNSMTSRGYKQDDINLMMSDDTRKKYFSDADTELGSKAMEGAGTGGAIGGVAGAILGAVAAIGTSVLIPGLGLVIAGPLAGALAGAGAGGLTGGLVGALIGAGIPEEHAKVYENDVKNGRIVMGLTPRSQEDADYLTNEWKDYRGDRITR